VAEPTRPPPPKGSKLVVYLNDIEAVEREVLEEGADLFTILAERKGVDLRDYEEVEIRMWESIRLRNILIVVGFVVAAVAYNLWVGSVVEKLDTQPLDALIEQSMLW